MLSKFVDESLSKHVRLLVEVTLVLYSCGSQASYADCDSTSLWSLRSFTGTRVFQGLEQALGNASVATASLEKLTALFLVLFATIISVGYSNRGCPSGDPSASTVGLPVYQSQISTDCCTSSPPAHVFSEAQKHLLRILAHHMVYIAERINLLEPKVPRKRIVEGSACRWNRRAMFQWNEMPAPKAPDVHGNLVSFCDVQDNSRRADRTPSQVSTSTHDTNSDQASVCRSCNFAALPFDTLDQDELCQFCSAFPQHGGDTVAPPSNDLPDQALLAQGHHNLLNHEHRFVNLLV